MKSFSELKTGTLSSTADREEGHAVASTPLVPVAHSKHRIIGNRQRLSDSVLWQIQRDFYTDHSKEAWREGKLPFDITSNPFIARAYARIVYGFWKDSGLASGRPLRIVELGTGHGRFGYLFLKAFCELHHKLSPPGAAFQYVMTDFSRRNLEFLMAHPRLRPLVEKGQLDFALFDAERDESLRWVRSRNESNQPETVPAVAVIANYVFDSIAADAFSIRQNQLFETLVTVKSSTPDLDWNDPQLLSKLCISCEANPASTEYYHIPLWNQILDEYRKKLKEASLLFPIAALQCIERLQRMAGENFLMLAADKGVNHEDELTPCEGLPGMTIHGDCCFSLNVNFDAMGKHVLHSGGQVLGYQHHATSLYVAGYLLGRGEHAFAETSQAFADSIERCGPDDFFALGVMLEAEEELPLNEILAYLRLGGWSSAAFLQFFPAILRALPEAAETARHDLHDALQHIWATYFSIGEEADIAFHVGALLLEMNYHREAMPFFHESAATRGSRAATSYNLGACFFGLGQIKESLACVDEALKLDPGMELAQRLRARLIESA